MIVPRKIEKDKGLIAKYAGIPLMEVKWMPRDHILQREPVSHQLSPTSLENCI